MDKSLANRWLVAVTDMNTKDEIDALVAQSQKRSAVYDIITNPTNVNVVVNQ